jgi:hypothetical protein
MMKGGNKMLKITVQVVENKDQDTCKVNLQTPKDFSKAAENEKKVSAMVIDKITKALEELAS